MRRLLIAAASLIVSLTACGGDDPAGPNEVTLVNGTYSGTVNGGAYSPISVSVFNTGSIVALGAVDIQGRSVSWAFNHTGAGTYTIAGGIGNNATYTEGNSSWEALSGQSGSGSVTFTTLTSSRATGSFTLNLVADPQTTATGTRTVTGTFDITY